jgi:perosamine synthetase
MIPLAIPNLCGNEGSYLQECVTTGFVSSVGPFVGRFEKMVAASAETPDAVATSSGTTGLHLALICAGVLPGDLVVTTAFSFIATANAIAHCGASPWFFDISGRDWCLDAGLLVETLRKETVPTATGLRHKVTGRRVAALMPVYTNGYIPAGFRAIAEEFGLPLVADAAPAIGSQRDGKGVGTFADLTVFSFNGNKTVTTGGGGAVVCHDPALLARARHLSSTARVGADYDHDTVGYNYRMTNVEAAIGCAQLENLSRFVAAKRHIRDFYNNALLPHAGATLFPDTADKGNACWFSGFVLPADGRIPFESFAQKLNAGGVQCRAFWKPLHMQKPFGECPKTQMTVCESLWHRVVVLPCSSQLSEEDMIHVIRVVESALKG